MTYNGRKRRKLFRADETLKSQGRRKTRKGKKQDKRKQSNPLLYKKQKDNKDKS